HLTSIGPPTAAGRPAWHRVIDARQRLDAKFLPLTPPAGRDPAIPSPADALAATPPATSPPAATQPEATTAEEPAAATKAPEPALDARAERVWAQIQMLP